MKPTLGRGAVALATSTALAMVLTACGGGAPSATQSGGAVATLPATDVTTGIAKTDVDSVTWYGGYRPLYNLDPIKLADYPEQTAIPNMCESVLRMGADYSISPGIASKYAFTDPTHLVLTVRPGVTFWDGKPVTADDVTYSLNRNRDKKLGSNFLAAFTDIASIDVTAPDAVTLSFNKPLPTALEGLTTLGGAVVEKAFTEAAGAAFGSPNTGVMCSGPFQFVSYDGSSKLVMKRNEAYWDKPNRPHVGVFNLVFPTDRTALANGLMAGTIDGGFNIPSQLLPQLRGATTGKIYLGGPGSTPINLDLLMSSSTGVAADPRVRQALSKVIDREGIAKTVFDGTADPLYQVSGPGMWRYSRLLFQQAYDALPKNVDVAGAKALIEQAGATGKPVTLVYSSGDAQGTQIATVVQQAAQQIGLQFNIIGLPAQQFGSLFDSAEARKPYDMIITKNYVAPPDPVLMDRLYGASTGINNFSSYANTTVDDATSQAVHTPDDDQRAKLVLEAEAQLSKDLPSIPIVAPRAVVFESNRLTGSTLTFSYMVSPWATVVGGK